MPFEILDNRHYPIVIPDATEESAGVMSPADKIQVDHPSIASYTYNQRDTLVPLDGMLISNIDEGGAIQRWSSDIGWWLMYDGKPSWRDWILSVLAPFSTSMLLTLRENISPLTGTTAHDDTGHGNTATYGLGWSNDFSLLPRSGAMAIASGQDANAGTLLTDEPIAFDGPNNGTSWMLGFFMSIGELTPHLPQLNLFATQDGNVTVSFTALGGITTQVNGVGGPSAPNSMIRSGKSYLIILQYDAGIGEAQLFINRVLTDSVAGIPGGSASPLAVTVSGVDIGLWLQNIFFSEFTATTDYGGAGRISASGWPNGIVSPLFQLSGIVAT